MRRNLLFSLLSFSFSCLYLVSCQKKTDADTYIVTGSVIDQVTRQPVTGATIYKGYMSTSDSHSKIYGSPVTTSGQNGEFSISFSNTDYDPPHRFPYIYAGKSGYAGSNNIFTPNPGSFRMLELYHIAELNLRVRNDTINILPTYLKRDDVYVSVEEHSALSNYPDFIGSINWDLTPQYFKYCKGRNLDTALIIAPLWGNVNYSIKFYGFKPNSISFPSSYYSKSIIIKPDSVAYVIVLF
jgi:hypothetical protein